MKMYKVAVFVWIALIILLLHDPATDGNSYGVEIEPFQYVPEIEKLSDSGGKTVETGCHYQMDLVLVLDSSYTITSDGWDKLKDAAKRLTDKLDVSSSGTHVSILVYSTDVDDYYIFDASKGKISKLIDELTYYGEWSRLDRALEAVLQRVFSPLNGARNDVPKVVVVFTDGKQEAPATKPGQQPDLIRPLKEAIGNLRKENVTLFFAATEVSGFQVLNLIGEDESRIIGIKNIDRLVERLLGASKMTCSEKSKDKDVPFSPGDESTITMTTTIRTTVTVTVAESLFQTPATQKLSSKGSAAAQISLSAIPASVLTSTIGTTATQYSQLASSAGTKTEKILTNYSLSAATAVKSLSPTAPSEATLSAWTAKATKTLLQTPSNKFIFSTETTTTVENLSPKPSNEPTFSILTSTATNAVSLTPSNELISPTATATTGAIVAPTPSTKSSPISTETTIAWEAISPISPSKPNIILAGTATATESPTPSKEIISISKIAAVGMLSVPTPFNHVPSATGKAKDYDVLLPALSSPPTSSKETLYTTTQITATPAVLETSLFTVTLPQ